MTVDAVVRARMASSRLPGKTLLTAAGKTMLEHTIDRLRHVERLSRIVVATTDQPDDDPIAAVCEMLGVPCYRGSADDVLGRVYTCAIEHGMAHVAHFGADNPLVDPTICDRIIDVYLDGEWDYVTNNMPPTFPDGLEVEITSIEALATAAANAAGARQREHMLTYLWDNAEQFRIHNVEHSPSLHAERWTLDSPEDFELIRSVLDGLPSDPPPGIEAIIDYLDRHPGTRELNASAGGYAWLAPSTTCDQAS